MCRDVVFYVPIRFLGEETASVAEKRLPQAMNHHAALLHGNAIVYVVVMLSSMCSNTFPWGRNRKRSGEETVCGRLDDRVETSHQ